MFKDSVHISLSQKVPSGKTVLTIYRTLKKKKPTKSRLSFGRMSEKKNCSNEMLNSILRTIKTLAYSSIGLSRILNCAIF